jgi:hypothetical protein
MGALLITLPATIVTEFVTLPPQITGLYGSLWRGRAQLSGGNTLEWTTDPRGLILLQVRADITLNGPDTHLSGSVTLTPWAVGVEDLTGRAGAGLLQLVPDILVKSCSARAFVDIRSLRLSRGAASADGLISIDAGVCIDAFGRRQTVPEMDLGFLTQDQDAVAVLTHRDEQFAHFTVAGDRKFTLRIEPEGATLIPGLPTSGPIILEYPF